MNRFVVYKTHDGNWAAIDRATGNWEVFGRHWAALRYATRIARLEAEIDFLKRGSRRG